MILDIYSREFQGARVNNLDDFLLAVADVKLTIDISGCTVVVGVHSECPALTAVEHFNDFITVDHSVGEVVRAVLEQVNTGCQRTALRVLLNPNCEVEAPVSG